MTYTRSHIFFISLSSFSIPVHSHSMSLPFTIQQVFQLASNEVQYKLTNLSHADLGFFYGHYKQATMGDNETSEPWFIDVKGQKKWQAWTACKGMTQDDAMRAYCEKANTLLLEQFQVSILDKHRALFSV